MRRMVTINTWGGRGAGVGIAGESYRVRVDESHSGLEAAIARIDRELRGTGSHVIQCSSQGTSLNDGEAESNHYELTLGYSARGGGSSVEGSLWIAVPVGTGAGHVGYRG